MLLVFLYFIINSIVTLGSDLYLNNINLSCCNLLKHVSFLFLMFDLKMCHLAKKMLLISAALLIPTHVKSQRLRREEERGWMGRVPPRFVYTPDLCLCECTLLRMPM